MLLFSEALPLAIFLYFALQLPDVNIFIIILLSHRFDLTLYLLHLFLQIFDFQDVLGDLFIPIQH